MYLFINSATPDQGALWLVSPQGSMVTRATLACETKKRANVLKEIDTLLIQQGVLTKDLKGVCVITGPGHFSYLRTGIVIANTFGYILSVPVTGIRLDEFENEQDLFTKGTHSLEQGTTFAPVMAEYGQEPNITKAKPLA